MERFLPFDLVKVYFAVLMLLLLMLCWEKNKISFWPMIAKKRVFCHHD
jgi:hypothetical protein